jgi:hypothetical protein
LESEYGDEDHHVVSKRLQQLQATSAQTMKNAKKPEAFIYVLKVNTYLFVHGCSFLYIIG